MKYRRKLSTAEPPVGDGPGPNPSSAGSGIMPFSCFVKIVNFVRQARARDPICLMAVTRKCRRKLSTAEPPVGDGLRPIGTQRR